MGKNPFEDDSDVQAMRASMRPAAGAVRWGKVLTGTLIVACVTFVFAYYLPLERAHTRLNQRFSELQAQVGSAHQALEESRKQARAVAEKQQALESESDQAKQAEKARALASHALKSALETKLQKPLAKDQAAIGLAGARAVASLSFAYLLTPGKLELSPPGKLALCGVASASNDRSIRVIAVSDKKSIPPAVAVKLKTPLQYSVGVAQLVTETLLDKCNIAAARLSATGVPAEPPPLPQLEGKKIAGPRVELWLD
jgi:chemotaxis protein MotB